MTHPSYMHTLTILALVVLTVPVMTAGYSVGDPVDNFTLLDADNTPVDLFDFKGSVILINFWTSG